MKAVLYARVSSDKQAERDLSISAQLKAVRRHAAEKGYDIVREFIDEAESARTANRLAFQEMIALAKSKPKPFDVILVWKLSRFARNREDSIIYKSLLRKRAIQVISINEPVDDSPAGALFEGMIEVIDEFYSANLAQDTKRGLRENAQRGYCNGGVAPLGYQRRKVRDGSAVRSALEPDPETAHLVKRIFKLCLKGMGAKEIAKLLNNEGLRTRKGGAWSKWGVLYILKNPIYTGRYIYARFRDLSPGEERFTVDGKIKPLVSADQFEKVQALLGSRSPKNHSPRRISSMYLLSGIIYCGKCGRALQGGSAKSGQFQYYSCYNYLRKGKSVCDARSVNCERIDRAIIEKLKERVLTPQHLSDLLGLTNVEIKEHVSARENELRMLEKQALSKQAKLDRLYNALESGELSVGDLAPRIRKLKGELSQLVTKIESTKLQAALEPSIKTLSKRQLGKYVSDLYSLLQEGTVFERREFLRSFIKRISFDYPRVKVDYTFPLADKPPFSSEVLSFVKKSGLYETSSATG